MTYKIEFTIDRKNKEVSRLFATLADNVSRDKRPECSEIKWKDPRRSAWQVPVSSFLRDFIAGGKIKKMKNSGLGSRVAVYELERPGGSYISGADIVKLAEETRMPSRPGNQPSALRIRVSSDDPTDVLTYVLACGNIKQEKIERYSSPVPFLQMTAVPA